LISSLSNNIIHRDVRPANILYTLRSHKCHFHLGDFGISNRLGLAATYAGSPLYTAPEICFGGEQTHKADIWSLYFALLWTLAVEGFRKMSDGFKNFQKVQNTVALFLKVDRIAAIRDMAVVDHERRASAAQMLVKCFEGNGLTTPKHLVPALASSNDGKPNPVVQPSRFRDRNIPSWCTTLEGLSKEDRV
jgi:serine/threonine protein kinase